MENMRYTIDELTRLQEKAEIYLKRKGNDGNFKVCQYLTRNKPEDYFKEIMCEKKGEMEVYIKDNNGDYKSPINGRIKGLFFSSFMREKTGLPPRYSPFGKVRLSVTPSFMLKPNVILYFADFYCFGKSYYKPHHHYITIVATEEDTEEERYCSQNLVLLNRENNSFLKTSDDKSWDVVTDVIVEVFYTSDIHIPTWIEHGATWDNVESTHSGESRPNGIPKNKNCRICNL